MRDESGSWQGTGTAKKDTWLMPMPDRAPPGVMTAATPMTPYQQDRLRFFVAPVIPPMMLGVSGATLALAVGYWTGLVPGHGASPVVLFLGAMLSAVFALVARAAAKNGNLDLTGYSACLFILAVCGGMCGAAYFDDQGIVYGLPYCMLSAVAASFFWLRRRHFIGGQLAAFVPPLLLLVGMPHARSEWSFAIQLATIALIGSTGIFLLTARTNQRLYALSSEVEHRATYDGLTGLLNRSTWIEQAETRLAEEQRRGRQITCLFIDLDRFKQVNDVLGHSAGDELLCQVAKVLQEYGLPDRLAGRIGGDEFVMLLPGIGAKQAEDLVDGIVEAIQAAQHDRTGPVASIGIAASTGEDSLDHLLRRADLAMMNVKEGNRERSRTDDPPPPNPLPAAADWAQSARPRREGEGYSAVGSKTPAGVNAALIPQHHALDA